MTVFQLARMKAREIIKSLETRRRMERKIRECVQERQYKWNEVNNRDNEQEREEIDLVSNVYRLKHSTECAELWLMVDIKT